jgi:hypothetical protein
MFVTGLGVCDVFECDNGEQYMRRATGDVVWRCKCGARTFSSVVIRHSTLLTLRLHTNLETSCIHSITNIPISIAFFTLNIPYISVYNYDEV